MDISQETLRTDMDYNPETGALIWKAREEGSFKRRRSWLAWNTRFSGKRVGALHASGYIYTKYRGGVHLVHRIIWMWMHGTLPEQIDHINHCRSDNRMVNLRPADPRINGANITLPSDNTSGRIGVYRGRGAGTWVAKICVNGKKMHLGTFRSFSSAAKVRASAEKMYMFHENHGMQSNDNFPQPSNTSVA
jgi:hypothetical protein